MQLKRSPQIDQEVAEFIAALSSSQVTQAMIQYLRLRDAGQLETQYPGFLRPRGYEVLSFDGSERFRGRRLLTICFDQHRGSILDRNRLDSRTDQVFRGRIQWLGFEILILSECKALEKWEGRRQYREASFFSRNPELARQAKEKANYTCQVCGLDPRKLYGIFGDSCIEAHHLEQFADRTPGEQNEGKATQLEDLAALCANCHSVVHSKRPCHSLKSVAAMLKPNE